MPELALAADESGRRSRRRLCLAPLLAHATTVAFSLTYSLSTPISGGPRSHPCCARRARPAHQVVEVVTWAADGGALEPHRRAGRTRAGYAMPELSPRSCDAAIGLTEEDPEAEKSVAPLLAHVEAMAVAFSLIHSGPSPPRIQAVLEATRPRPSRRARPSRLAATSVPQTERHRRAGRTRVCDA
ncbi:hypothetical protein B0H12DRAFT_105884 [Mycena haematopus]|nr:hypothetical protein B0H12DRAFT_105884 [Mycena haematopus]